MTCAAAPRLSFQTRYYRQTPVKAHPPTTSYKTQTLHDKTTSVVRCGTMKLVLVSGVSILFVLSTTLHAVLSFEVDITFNNGVHQRLYYRDYYLICPKTVFVDNSYTEQNRLVIIFENVEFIKVGDQSELRQTHKHSRRVSFYKFQLVDSAGESINFNTIQPLYAEDAPYYLFLGCNQTLNRLSIRIRDQSKSNLLSPQKLYKQQSVTENYIKRELYAKKDHKSTGSSSSGTSGNSKSRRGISRRNKTQRKLKKIKLARKTKPSITKIIVKLKPVLNKKSKQ